MRVDCQSHVFPRDYAELLLQSTTTVRTVRDGPAYRVSYGTVQQFVLALDAYDPAAKIRDMDAAGIDVSVLTVNIPGPELLDRELGIAGARLCNDYLADLAARYPGRFVGLATLPPFVAMIVWRLLDEERFLVDHLPGYAEYRRRVKWRLIPRVW